MMNASEYVPDTATPEQRPAALGVDGAVDLYPVVAQIDHELDSAARQDPVLTWGLSPGDEPHALDELVQRSTWTVTEYNTEILRRPWYVAASAAP